LEAFYALVAVAAIAGLGYAGGEVTSLRTTFAVVVPYTALGIFLAGFSYKVIQWAWAPVPFRIPTTCGQQKSLPWIKAAWIENPSTRFGVLVRMVLEVLLFRSLFRNSRAELRAGPRLIYKENKFLWLGAMAFHWALLLILLRHLRLFLEPVPRFVVGVDQLDAFFHIGAPTLYLTDFVILAGLLYLLGRRLWDAQVRYLSLPADYFALYLLLGVVISGILMRYVWKADVAGVKELVISLAAFSPTVPASVGPVFFVHLTLVSFLAAYFPFSKLMHAGGTFLSPTHNLANNSRMKRHVNPWNCPVKVHTYAEWEDEFRDKIRSAGLPLEKE
jgi:nitrate reductase gamma subunit